MKGKRVVITGLGAISPVGLSAQESWEAVLSGRSGVTHITHFDVTNFPTKIAATVKDFDPTRYVSAKEARKLDPFILYGVAAADEAIKDAGFMDDNRTPADRVGVVFGSGIGGMHLTEKNTLALHQSGVRRVAPTYIPSSIINMVAGQISIQYGFTGPNLSIVTACTTGLHCVGEAARLIAWGDCDVVIAGGSECASTPLGMAGFSAAKALSTRNDEPTKASRPWDRDRDGFVLADGGAALVLESLEHAQRRGARIYAEIGGFGMSGDAYHVTAPPEDGRGAALAMRNALRDGDVEIEMIDYINAHGTSTPLGDLAETNAVKHVFGGHAYKLMISSTKSTTGHLLGAAGAIETLFTTLAIYHQVVPPTINLDNPDDGCDLDYVPHVARDAKIDCALCNSFGFGGTNGSLLIRRFA